MKFDEKTVILRCDCNCSMLVVEKCFYHDGDTDYNISIQSSRYDRRLNTLWGRIKRAFKTLFGRPIYYNDIQIMKEQNFKDFVDELHELVDYKEPVDDGKTAASAEGESI